VRAWSAEQVAAAAGAALVSGGGASGPEQAVIDSRAVGPGDLFVGLVGERADGGTFAAGALEAGAWGVLVAPQHAEGLSGGAVLAAEDPLAALQRLATAWRRELGAAVIGITGSVGKTSTKDVTRALIAPHRRVHASRANFNTEIGLPLELLRAPDDSEVLILEMGMRGPGQIAELVAIAEPDVGVVTAIGPGAPRAPRDRRGDRPDEGRGPAGRPRGRRAGRRAAARAVAALRCRARALRAGG
jgi:UDP-N-acetylmuramoyl-tripeptide--D-alanyl-D-alanine ligase